MRTATIERKTSETDISITLNLDGSGKAKLDYPIGFMKHMLNTFAKHGLFDLEVMARGDLEIDQHHLVEDTGIVLGQCFAKALGDKRGIVRVGSCLFPMDETLVRVSADVSGRAFMMFNAQLSGIPLISAPVQRTNNQGIASESASFQTDIVEDFWQGFTSTAALTLHLEILYGRNDHHKIEALFKAAARALRQACEIDSRAAETIPSTKGTIG
ncbi:MAG: imidazoleglycerol-phosphate dehydratase HisB [Treponema sp.]|nr:imidazoleglycerol-phosphate dehydratase HisB [Treponema sp.]